MSDAAAASRAFFPRGLYQPPGSFRFSADALLLAAFVLRRCLPERRAAALLDLGCGCGVVGLACLLANPDLTATGVDLAPELTDAARENAARMGLGSRFSARVADLAAEKDRAALEERSYAVVAANMPYRAAGSGRLPPSALRARALFADGNTMAVFMDGARRALAEGGSFALVYPWDGRERLLAALAAHGFAPLEMLPVLTGRETGARCLVRAVHAARACPDGEAAMLRHPPLVLREAKNGPYTEEARRFCPWLGVSGAPESKSGMAQAPDLE